MGVVQRVLAVASIVAGCTGLAVAEPSPALAATPTDAVRSDAVVRVGQTVTLVSKTPLVGVGNAADVVARPSDCRSDPIMSRSCKAFRVTFERDTNPLAENVAFFDAEFDQLRVPALNLPVAPLYVSPLNGVDIHVFDRDGHYLGENAPDAGGATGVSAIDGPLATVLAPINGEPVGDPTDVNPGGATYADPERGSFDVKQRTYDIVVEAAPGVNTGFTLHVRLSNEIFPAPFELLDEIAYAIPPLPFAFPVGGAGLAHIDDARLPTLAGDLSDDAIARVGAGVVQQFNAPALSALRASRPIPADPKTPSTIALVLWLVVLPAVVGGLLVATIHRRSRLLI